MPKIVEVRHPILKDGVEYAYRPMGNSGHPKIDIKDPVSIPGKEILEKITFK